MPHPLLIRADKIIDGVKLSVKADDLTRRVRALQATLRAVDELRYDLVRELEAIQPARPKLKPLNMTDAEVIAARRFAAKRFDPQRGKFVYVNQRAIHVLAEKYGVTYRMMYPVIAGISYKWVKEPQLMLDADGRELKTIGEVWRLIDPNYKF
jgi:hypothetical protein